jgi:hypothetical protein
LTTSRSKEWELLGHVSLKKMKKFLLMIKNKLPRLKKKGEPQKKRLGIKLIRIKRFRPWIKKIRNELKSEICYPSRKIW